MTVQSLRELTVYTLEELRNLTAVHGAGVYSADFGSGRFRLFSDADGWALVLQYHHQGTTQPALNVIPIGGDWPIFSSKTLGTDMSGGLAYFGHIAQAYAASIPDAPANLNLRWFGQTRGLAGGVSINDGRRVIHFESPVLGHFQSNLNPNFVAGGIQATNTKLPGHTAFLPDSATTSLGNGDETLTFFPFFTNSLYHWGILAPGTGRTEVDDFSNGTFNPVNFSADTIHRVWVRYD